VKVRPDAYHIDYCLTPTRYVWMPDAYLQREGFGKAVEWGMKPLAAWLKRRDYEAAQRVTHFVAISTEVQQRIRRYYHRDSSIIFPPVDVHRFRPNGLPPEPFFFVLSRLIPYKRIDLAVRACNLVGCRLVVAGSGRDREALATIAGPTIEFRGYVSDEEAADLMARCQAFIFPGLEDFGITPLQAQAAGRPVIAYGAGGALDTVISGETGEFFTEQTPEALAQVLASFAPARYDPAACRANAERFSNERFRQELGDYVRRVAAGQEPPSARVASNSTISVDRDSSKSPTSDM